MRLTRRHVVPFPADVVFERARDELHVLADLLPDVESIEPLRRRVDARCVERVDRWRTRTLGASRRAVPTTRLAWTSRSRWDATTQRVSWTIDLHEPARAATCTGELRIRALGEHETELRITTEVRVDTKAVASIARLLSFALRPMVDRTVRRLLDRNLSTLLHGIAEAA